MKKRVQVFQGLNMVIAIAVIKITVFRFLGNGFSRKINSVVGKNVFMLKLRNRRCFFHYFFSFGRLAAHS